MRRRFFCAPAAQWLRGRFRRIHIAPSLEAWSAASPIARAMVRREVEGSFVQPTRGTHVILALTLAAASLFSDLHWRDIGPYRGGRTKAASGVAQRPGTFYIGAVNGGVFRSDDYGRTWTPLFDDQPTGSIGALAVAPSNPDVIYVGSGEGLQRPDLSTGDGVYKSVDAGKTWAHLG